MIEDGGGGAEAVQRAQGKIYEALCQQSVELVREPIMYILVPLYYHLYTCITLLTPMYTRYTCIYTIQTPYIHPNTPLNTPYTPYIRLKTTY